MVKDSFGFSGLNPANDRQLFFGETTKNVCAKASLQAQRENRICWKVFFDEAAHIYGARASFFFLFLIFSSLLPATTHRHVARDVFFPGKHNLPSSSALV